MKKPKSPAGLHLWAVETSDQNTYDGALWITTLKESIFEATAKAAAFLNSARRADAKITKVENHGTIDA